MELINQLGAAIERRWRDLDYDESKFPEIAAQELRAANIPSQLSAWDVVEWAMNETFLPDQRDAAGRFGEPPVTIFNAPRFHVDVYFWLEGTTAIHQHAFCGAFQVLLGSSIHSWYDFDRSESVNTFAEIGTMRLKLCELLSVGDVQAISAGRQYIHGLFHLDQPSATLIARTHKSPMFLPQYSYYKPHLAIDPFFEEVNASKKMQFVSMLIRAKHPRADEFIAGLLRESDFQTTFQILQSLRGLLRANGVEQMFGLDSPRSRFEALFDVVRERHGERANVFPDVFAHLDKLDEILRLRRVVTDPEHRFFLALLLNVDGRDNIFSLVRERYPDADPREKVLDWIYDLGNTRVVGDGAANALGLATFDEMDLAIVEELLHGRTDDEAREAIAAAGGAARLGEFADRVAKLRAAAMFQPLLG